MEEERFNLFGDRHSNPFRHHTYMRGVSSNYRAFRGAGDDCAVIPAPQKHSADDRGERGKSQSRCGRS
jgi:hypothetical protein